MSQQTLNSVSNLQPEAPVLSDEEKFRLAYNKAKSLKEEGNRLYREKDYVAAIKKYYEAAESLHNEKYQKARDPEYLDLKLNLVTNISQALYASKSYSEVIEQCKYSAKEFPNNIKLKYYHALALSEESDFDDAISLLRSALTLEPNNKSIAEKIKEIAQKKRKHNEELKKSYGGMLLNKEKPKQEPEQTQNTEAKKNDWSWAIYAGLSSVIVLGSLFLINYTRQPKSL